MYGTKLVEGCRSGFFHFDVACLLATANTGSERVESARVATPSRSSAARDSNVESKSIFICRTIARALVTGPGERLFGPSLCSECESVSSTLSAICSCRQHRKTIYTAEVLLVRHSVFTLPAAPRYIKSTALPRRLPLEFYFEAARCGRYCEPALKRNTGQFYKSHGGDKLMVVAIGEP